MSPIGVDIPPHKKVAPCFTIFINNRLVNRSTKLLFPNEVMEELTIRLFYHIAEPSSFVLESLVFIEVLLSLVVFLNPGP